MTGCRRAENRQVEISKQKGQEVIRQVVGTLFDVADRLAQRRKKERVERPYLFEPLRTSDPIVAANMVRMIKSGAGVPLVPSRGDDLGKLRAFYRRARIEVATQRTTPKPAFEVIRWQHIQASDIDDELVCGGSAGSALLVCLDPKESRRHFIRSAQACLSGGRKLVALARPEDLDNPASWVRCVWVDAFRIADIRGVPTEMAIPSSSAIDPSQTATARLRQKDVPPGALWLFCDSDDQGEPGENWGENQQGHEAAPRPATPPGTNRRVKAKARSRRRYKSSIWLIAAFVPAGITFPWWSSDGLDNFEIGLLVFSVSWLAAAAAVAAAAAWALVKGECLALWWGLRDRGRAARWEMGTARALLLPQLLREVALKPGKEWEEVWARAWPDADTAGEAVQG